MQPVIVRGGGRKGVICHGQGTSILSRGGGYQSIIPIMSTLLVCRNSSLLDCCDPNYDLALFFKSFFFFLNRMVCCRLPQSE